MSFSVAGVSNSVYCSLSRHSDTYKSLTFIGYRIGLLSPTCKSVFTCAVSVIIGHCSSVRTLTVLTRSGNYIPTVVTLGYFELRPRCVFMRYVWSKATVVPFSRIGFLYDLCETGTNFIRFRNQI